MILCFQGLTMRKSCVLRIVRYVCPTRQRNKNANKIMEVFTLWLKNRTLKKEKFRVLKD